MNIINLGILAHIDAGKTSVTENLLFACGATEKRGSVDKGDTITDSMDIEKIGRASCRERVLRLV